MMVWRRWKKGVIRSRRRRTTAAGGGPVHQVGHEQGVEEALDPDATFGSKHGSEPGGVGCGRRSCALGGRAWRG
jgi:hypothetical protein